MASYLYLTKQIIDLFNYSQYYQEDMAYKLALTHTKTLVKKRTVFVVDILYMSLYVT